jgi:hypothetical protein
MPEDRFTTGPVDCQSNLFFSGVLDLMRRRKNEPLVYNRDGTSYLKLGDWLRAVSASDVSVDATLAAIDANGIEISMLSANNVRKSGKLDFRTDWVHHAPTPARHMT